MERVIRFSLSQISLNIKEENMDFCFWIVSVVKYQARDSCGGNFRRCSSRCCCRRKVWSARDVVVYVMSEYTRISRESLSGNGGKIQRPLERFLKILPIRVKARKPRVYLSIESGLGVCCRQLPTSIGIRNVGRIHFAPSYSYPRPMGSVVILHWSTRHWRRECSKEWSYHCVSTQGSHIHLVNTRSILLVVHGGWMEMLIYLLCWTSTFIHPTPISSRVHINCIITNIIWNRTATHHNMVLDPAILCKYILIIWHEIRPPIMYSASAFPHQRILHYWSKGTRTRHMHIVFPSFFDY